MATLSFTESLAAARRAGAPLVSMRTADPEACIAAVSPTLHETLESKDCPIVQWDAARGLTARNKSGQASLSQALVESKTKVENTYGFLEAMTVALKLAKFTVLFLHNAGRQMFSMEPAATAANVQAVCNVRDPYKTNFRTAIFIGTSFTSPPELVNDIIAIDHPLPDKDALEKIVGQLHKTVNIKIDKPKMAKAVEALVGTSHFSAETVTSMSFMEDGVDIEQLWSRKITTINETPGLSVWRGKERFSDLVGLDAIKAHFRNRMKARTPIGVVVWIDEIDKVFANVESDTTGSRMDQMRTMLVEMENNHWKGVVACGVGGSGKSALAKALGNEAGVLTIALDLAGTESKWVGESEQQLRRAMNVIKAVGDGHAYIMATSNNATVMRPELQRRFTDGMWMFDLPNDEMRAAAWSFYIKKFGLDAKQPKPNDDRWVPSEILKCCEYAWDTNCSLLESAKFVLPMAVSRVDEIEALRAYAQNRFLDANTGGPFVYDPKPMEPAMRALAIAPSVKTVQ